MSIGIVNRSGVVTDTRKGVGALIYMEMGKPVNGSI